MITIPRDVCVDLNRALSKEWLVANGIGGFASSSITGANTRRYHALLVAALKPPVERTVLLSKIDEEAEIDARTYYLSTNEYPDGKINPGGFVHIEEFRLYDNIPTTVFRLGDNVLHKTVWMEHGHNTTYIRYTYVEGALECCLLLNPLCNYRDYHDMTNGYFDWNFEVEPLPGGCKIIAREGALPYWLTTEPAAQFTPTGVWYWNFVYRQEIERGFDQREDLYVPGVIRAVLQPGESVTVIAGAEPPEATRPLVSDALERERLRQTGLLKAARIPASAQQEAAANPGAKPAAFNAQLAQAANTFFVMRNLAGAGRTRRAPTVIAGYPWFTDWGRDAMISLPGLAVPTGQTREANQVLKAFALFIRDGLLPNNFPDVGFAPQYNTADATLWMLHTVQTLAQASGNLATARALYPQLSDIIAWHVRGTRFGIGMDPQDGLLRAGEAGYQLTWMDAKVGDWVVTPRMGKPVEINALWYNALRVMEKLSMTLGGTAKPGKQEPPDFRELAEQARNSFEKRFWYSEGGYLFDVVDGPEGDDPSLRPNQVLAISLNNDLLGLEQSRSVLATVRSSLLTPYGLRTLSPDDPRYKGRCTGERRERDAAYHNGTVWPWLLGPYFDAVRRIEGSAAARAEFKATALPAMRKHLADAGLGTISEIFDGDPPHEPRGCISQAWSVAEVLRINREQ